MARGKKYLLGERRPDDSDQLLDALEAVAEAKLRRGHAEFGIIRADAQVAAQCEANTAADAIAADHRNGRLGKFVDRRVRLIDCGIIAIDRVPAGGLAFEFGNVGAGNEGFAASTSQHYD